jgi:hypothetical protein
MITVRQIDRLWSAKAYDRLLEQLISPRPEASDRLLSQLPGSLPAAAMAVIRLDELSQPFVPLYGQLVRTILAAQRPSEGCGGGWGDVATTALCLRALLCGQGHGVAIDRGIAALAALQKPEGIWPNMPVRRMPIDPFVSAFVLLLLGDHKIFRQGVQFQDAIDWFKSNELALDEQTASLWSHAKRRLPTKNPGSRVSQAEGSSLPGLPLQRQVLRQTAPVALGV